MKSKSKSLAKVKASKSAPTTAPASSAVSHLRSLLKFNADIPVYASSALGSFSSGAFVVGGGGGRARTGVKNGLHVLAPPFENPKGAGEENCLPFINLDNLRVLSVCSSNGRLYAATVESIVAFSANSGSHSRVMETSRLCLNFAKSAATIAHFESASAALQDEVSKVTTPEDRKVLSRAVDKAQDDLDSQNVRPPPPIASPFLVNMPPVFAQSGCLHPFPIRDSLSRRSLLLCTAMPFMSCPPLVSGELKTTAEHSCPTCCGLSLGMAERLTLCTARLLNSSELSDPTLPSARLD
jgi:hypothetical protein